MYVILCAIVPFYACFSVQFYMAEGICRCKYVEGDLTMICGKLILVCYLLLIPSIDDAVLVHTG